MRWITLIGDESLCLDTIKKIEFYGSISRYEVTGIRNRYCVDYGNDHMFYDYLGDSVGDYDEQDLKIIPFHKPHFIMIVYTSRERMNIVLKQNNFPKGIYVDNGNGHIIPIEELIELEMPLDSL